MDENPGTSQRTETHNDTKSDNKHRRTLLSLVKDMSSDSDDTDDDDLDGNQTFENRHILPEDYGFEFDLDDFDDLDDDDEEFQLDVLNERLSADVPLFPQGLEEFDEICAICYDTTTVRKRLCCDTKICEYCIGAYLEGCVSEGVVKIECPASECDSFIYRDEILARLPPVIKEKYYKFLIDANKDPYVKTCPRCSHVKKVSKAELEDKMVIKQGLEVACEKCELKWCFPCHAPWHTELTCKEYRKGDRLVQLWAHEVQCGQVNAQRCPSCKIFIQRTSGCDHMTCSSCKTSFCYRCGKRYRSIKMFGNHFSRFSPFGCKYNLLPNRPGTRRLVRGAVFGGKLIGSAVLAGLALAAGAVLVSASVVVVPAILGYRYNKRRRARRRARNNRMIPIYPELIYDRVEIHQTRNRNPLTIGNNNIPDLTNDDSSNPFLNNWVMLSRLSDAQQVEVLVHRNIGTAMPVAEGSSHSNQTDFDDNKTDSVVTITNITEEVTEGGYTRVVAHIVAKNSEEPTLVPINEQTESSSRKSSKSSISSEKEGKLDTARNASKDSIENFETDTSDVDLTGDTNGCFVNIFSKRLNPWQGNNTLPTTYTSSKTVPKVKSGTWEKSGKKLSNSNSIDIRTFSNILASQSEKDIKTCDSSADVPECSASQAEGFQLPCDYVTYL